MSDYGPFQLPDGEKGGICRVTSRVVPEELEGSRLDVALTSLFPEQSRNAAARLIAEGRVRVGANLAVKASRRVGAGEIVEVDLPPPLPTEAAAEEIKLSVLYQDSEIVVVDKPAGMVVHPAAGHFAGTLVNALLFHVKDLSGIGGEIRPGIVHRLDKDTSGVMVVAKNDQAHRSLTKAWGTGEVRKEYRAIVYGKPSTPRGRIDLPIGRDPRQRKRMAVVADGRASITDYETLETYGCVALLSCVLHTGRTHQIRVHLKALGHPIVGDALYGGAQWKGVPDRPIRQSLAAFSRQALHAHRITIVHPRTKEPMSFISPLPEDMKLLLDVIRGGGRSAEGATL